MLSLASADAPALTDSSAFNTQGSTGLRQPLINISSSSLITNQNGSETDQMSVVKSARDLESESSLQV